MEHSRTLTVGVDGSDTSSAALAWAAREASRRGDALRVVHSYSIPVYGGDFAGAGLYPAVDLETLHTERLKAVEHQLEPIRHLYPTLDVEAKVHVGWPTATLLDAAKGSDVVVVGSHGTGSVTSLLLGSVAHHLAHRSSCPTVLVPHGEIGPAIRRIVVGTDGSPVARIAADWARSETKLWDAELVIVHSWDYPYFDLGAHREMKAEAGAILREAAGLLDTPDEPIRIEARLEQGAAAPVLVEASTRADLLVVGARGRGPVRAALLGSTSSYAIQHAHCPVAIIHSDSHGYSRAPS
jgi:nucleotide-binding universal stress UspA family protein